MSFLSNKTLCEITWFIRSQATFSTSAESILKELQPWERGLISRFVWAACYLCMWWQAEVNESFFFFFFKIFFGTSGLYLQWRQTGKWGRERVGFAAKGCRLGDKPATAAGRMQPSYTTRLLKPLRYRECMQWYQTQKCQVFLTECCVRASWSFSSRGRVYSFTAIKRPTPPKKKNNKKTTTQVSHVRWTFLSIITEKLNLCPWEEMNRNLLT